MDPPSIPPPPPVCIARSATGSTVGLDGMSRAVGWVPLFCRAAVEGGGRRACGAGGARRLPHPAFPPQPLRSYYYSSTYSRVCILLSRSILARTGPCNYIYIYIYIVALAHCASVIRPTKNIHPHQRPISHHHQTTFSPHTHTHAHTHSPAPT